MNNKEVIDSLKEYFITQPPEAVAMLAGALMVDMWRMSSVDSLPQEEAACLFERIEKNAQSVRDFVINGPKGDLKIIKMNSDGT